MRVMNHNWSATKQYSSSAECSRNKPPFSFVRGQDMTTLDIIWILPQGHRSVSVSRHFFLQAPQCPCSVQKWLSRDHCCRGRSKPGCRIVGSHTRWELTTWANFQLCLHRLLMSAGCKSSHSVFLNVHHRNGGCPICFFPMRNFPPEKLSSVKFMLVGSGFQQQCLICFFRCEKLTRAVKFMAYLWCPWMWHTCCKFTSVTVCAQSVSGSSPPLPLHLARYEQFLQVGQLYRALILLSLALFRAPLWLRSSWCYIFIKIFAYILLLI